MNGDTDDITESIVETTWEEKDIELVVQYKLFKMLGLKSVKMPSQ